MELKLKFGVGDTAYTLLGSSVYAVRIKKIEINLQANYRLVKYEFDGGPHGFGTQDEKFMFSTKRELIESL